MQKSSQDGRQAVVARTWDVLGCGPRNQFWANGKIVSNCNLQNLPRGSELRRSIIAPKGHVLVVSDSAQIEARMLAWLAGQTDLLDAFRRGQDVYKLMASSIYGKPVPAITKDERFLAKVAVLGLGYGMGAKKFQATLELGMMGPPSKITAAEALRVVKLYRSKNFKIPLAWKQADMILHSMLRKQSGSAFNGAIEYDEDSLWLPNGMPINYPGLHMSEHEAIKYKSHDVYKKLYGGLVIENIVQAIARVAVGEQALLVEDGLKKLKLKKGEVAAISMLTHDEIVTTVPARLAEQQLKAQIACMRTPRPWCPDMPFDADGGYDTCYSK